MSTAMQSRGARGSLTQARLCHWVDGCISTVGIIYHRYCTLLGFFTHFLD